MSEDVDEFRNDNLQTLLHRQERDARRAAERKKAQREAAGVKEGEEAKMGEFLFLSPIDFELFCSYCCKIREKSENGFCSESQVAIAEERRVCGQDRLGRRAEEVIL